MTLDHSVHVRIVGGELTYRNRARATESGISLRNSGAVVSFETLPHSETRIIQSNGLDSCGAGSRRPGIARHSGRGWLSPLIWRVRLRFTPMERFEEPRIGQPQLDRKSAGGSTQGLNFLFVFGDQERYFAKCPRGLSLPGHERLQKQSSLQGASVLAGRTPKL
jgi:hypothetical protein